MQEHPDETLLLFDIDGTLTEPLQPMSEEMITQLESLKNKGYSLALVGGSSSDMISKQLGDSLSLFKYVATENGAITFHEGLPIMETTLGKWVGMDKVFELIIKINEELGKLQLPFVRPRQIDTRVLSINICPCGRDCSLEERKIFAAYDAEHKIREKLIKTLTPSLEALDMCCTIGGQISFDIYPKNFNKTVCLQCVRYSHFPDTRLKYKNIHFFGDKTHPGGNDHELYNHPDVIGHSVKSPSHTLEILKEF